MSYRIAIASSDGKNIDLTFGGASEFYIYESSDDGQYQFLETRSDVHSSDLQVDNHSACKEEKCGGGQGCGSHQGGCGSGNGGEDSKIKLIEDCRCVIGRKVGFNVQKQLEKKAISSFDVTGDVNEVLDKITFYFNRVDNHQSLRKTK